MQGYTGIQRGSFLLSVQELQPFLEEIWQSFADVTVQTKSSQVDDFCA